MDFIIKIYKILFVQDLAVFLIATALFYYSIFFSFNKKSKFIYFKFSIFILPLCFIFYKYSIVSNYFSFLGQDSIIEASNPDLGEALYFIKGFLTSLFDLNIFSRNRFWLIFISSLFSALTLYLLTQKIFQNKKIYSKIINYSFIALIFLASFYVINF